MRLLARPQVIAAEKAGNWSEALALYEQLLSHEEACGQYGGGLGGGAAGGLPGLNAAVGSAAGAAHAALKISNTQASPRVRVRIACESSLASMFAVKGRALVQPLEHWRAIRTCCLQSHRS